MRGWTSLLKPWVLSVLALSLGPGCGGAGEPPILGPNLLRNGSFEAGLEPWWTATEEDGKASLSGQAADLGNMGVVLTKGTTGWGSQVGQQTEPHQPGETYQVRARLKGVQGGESVTVSFHGQSFTVEAGTRWTTATGLLYLPEVVEDRMASISVSLITNGATVYVDDVAASLAKVARGDADEEEDNLLLNGSFESGLGMWRFWTDAGPEGTASTSPDARQSGYAGMVLSKGPSGARATVKQQLRELLAEREEYRLEAHVRGTQGGEAVALCVQMNEEPYDGPCIQLNATPDWTHISEKLIFDPALINERVGVVVALLSEGTVLVDDVILVRRFRVP